MANDLILVQVNFAVPADREDEIKDKLDKLAAWFMDKEKIKHSDLIDDSRHTGHPI